MTDRTRSRYSASSVDDVKARGVTLCTFDSNPALTAFEATYPLVPYLVMPREQVIDELMAPDGACAAAMLPQISYQRFKMEPKACKVSAQPHPGTAASFAWLRMPRARALHSCGRVRSRSRVESPRLRRVVIAVCGQMHPVETMFPTMAGWAASRENACVVQALEVRIVAEASSPIEPSPSFGSSRRPLV